MAEMPSYQQLLAYYKLEEADMKERCSEEAIKALAPKLTNWELDHLCMGKETVDSVRSDFKKEEEKKLNYLLRWREAYSINATYDEIAKRFMQAGKAGLAEHVCEECKRHLKKVAGQQAQENGRDQTSHLVPGSKPSQNIVPQPSTAVPKSNSAWEVVTAFTSLLSSEKKEEMDMLARTESELIAEIEQVQSELKGKIEELKKKENEIQYMLEEQKRVHKEVKEKLRDKIVELRASLRVKTGELQQKREKQEELIWSATACTGKAKKLFDEAMKEGCVTVKLVKVLVVGSAGVGKTSLIKLLLDQDPPGERNSTGCLERSIRVIRVLHEKGKDQEGKWNEVPQEELDEMIAEAVPVLVKDLNKKNEKTKPKTAASHGEDPNEEERSTEGDGTRETHEEGDRNEGEDATMPHVVSTKDITEVIDTVTEKLARLVSSAKSSKRLLNMELIYLTDTGGQQEYWDLAPIFTRDTTATLFVHRLCDKLDDTPLNDVYERGERVGPSQKARITTAQAFKAMLQNSACGKSRSKIFVVGTYRDKAGSCEETLEQKNQKFKEIASPHKICHANEALKHIVFEVNTKRPSEEDKVKATKLKTSICKVNKTVEIPIWWLILQQVLEGIAKNSGMGILSKEDCIHASKALGFNETQLDAALEYFDKLNIFLYKPDILPDVVFTNSQVPLDKLSELVHKRHQLQAAEVDPTRASDEPCPGEWEIFRDHGILCTSLLDEFPKHYVKGVFTKERFILLLEELLIVSKSAEDEYFFPAILDVKEDIEIPPSPEIAPLVVRFPNGWAPPGVFCCTLCHLMSQAGWKIKQPTKSDSTDIPKEEVARNAITFERESEPGSVTIVDKIDFFLCM